MVIHKWQRLIYGSIIWAGHLDSDEEFDDVVDRIITTMSCGKLSRTEVRKKREAEEKLREKVKPGTYWGSRW